MTTYRRRALRAESVPDDGPIPFVVATEGRKPDGIDLRMDRADLGGYHDNPVVLANHNYAQFPIGHSENIRIEGDRLLADAIFDLEDVVGAMADRKYRNGHMRAVSVGFEVDGVDEATGVPERWKMLEFSAVSIGMDDQALKSPDRQARAFVDLLCEPTGRDGEVATATSDLLVHTFDHLSPLIKTDRKLAAVLADMRAGKVLSKANQNLVENAVDALTAVLEAAREEDEEDGDDGRGDAPKLARATRRLRLTESVI